MLLVFAENRNTAERFVRNLSYARPDLNLSQKQGWKYPLGRYSDYENHKGDVLLVKNWYDANYDTIYVMSLIEKGDYIDKTLEYTNDIQSFFNN